MAIYTGLASLFRLLSSGELTGFSMWLAPFSCLPLHMTITYYFNDGEFRMMIRLYIHMRKYKEAREPLFTQE